MKLYLASFMEKDNFGPSGRIISITLGSKPGNLNIKEIFLPLTPPTELILKYNSMRSENSKEASEYFISNYQKQLDNFVDEVEKMAAKSNLSTIDVLPFQEGDTLCSWERAKYTNYRNILAKCLERLGYEVVLN